MWSPILYYIETLYLLYNTSLLPFALTRIAFFACSAFHAYCPLHFRSHRLCHRRRNHLFQLGQNALLDRKVGTNHIVGRFTAGVLNDQLISNEACPYLDSQTLQKEQWGNVCNHSTSILTVRHLRPNICG